MAGWRDPTVEQSSGEIEQVHEETGETDPVKGKELITKRGKKPPLNFLAILFDANITLNTSSPDDLCDRLYAGVFLKENTLASSISISPHLILIDGTLSHNHVHIYDLNVIYETQNNAPIYIYIYIHIYI